MTDAAATPADLEAAVRRQPPLHALLTQQECAAVLGCGLRTFHALRVPVMEISERRHLYLWGDVVEALKRRKGNP